MIHIIIDSMSDITPEEAREMGAELLVLPVRFGGEEFYEGLNLSRKDFYARLQTCTTELPKTSQITPDTYLQAFREALAEDGAEALYLCGSSALSGCWQSACMACKKLEHPERVTLVDSLGVVSASGQLARMACRRKDEFASAEALGEWLISLRDHQRTYGQAGDMKYLVIGGRINPAVGKVGSALHLKPMLKLQDGVLHQAGLVRGREKTLNWYRERLEECPPRMDIPMVIAGAECPEAVQQLADYVRSLPIELPPIETMGIGTIVGTYGGQGSISITWVARD
ncbi:MAG: DegV family protein [Clostridia bacterium]|nr:DegV family protein [Clostridia bacterium]